VVQRKDSANSRSVLRYLDDQEQEETDGTDDTRVSGFLEGYIGAVTERRAIHDRTKEIESIASPVSV
jgi:hypothetical protein